MLNCCSECPGVFVPDAETNDENDANLPLIKFHHYKNTSSCYLNKQLFPKNGKTRPSFMNIEKVKKGKFITRKILVLKSCSIWDFHSEY